MDRSQLLTVDVFHHVLDLGLEGRGNVRIQSALITTKLSVDLRAVLARRTMRQAKITGRPWLAGLAAVCSIVALSGFCGVACSGCVIPACDRIRQVGSQI